MPDILKKFLFFLFFGGILIVGRFQNLLFIASVNEEQEGRLFKKAFLLFVIVILGFILVVDFLDHMFIQEEDRLLSRLNNIFDNGTKPPEDNVESNNRYRRLDDN